MTPVDPTVPGPCQVWSIVLDILIGKPGRDRALRLGAQAAVLATVVGGTVAYATDDTDVTLTVDGTARPVSADADTVGELLAAQQLTLGERDVVAPSVGSPIEDGDQVVVRFARRLTVTVDGAEQQYWTTELTVDSALAALGIRADGARLSASRSQPLGRQGLALSVTTPKRLTLAADGRTRKVTTTAPDVATLLTEQGVTLGALDKVSVLPTAPTVKGMVVAVTRIEKKRVTRTETIDHTSRTVRTATLFTGERTVVTKGRDGTRRATYALTLADGKVASRTLVRATVTREPVTEVIRVGTKPRPASTGGGTGGGGGSVPGADGLNWAALAQCESGGNPKAVNPAGPYYGLYQFSLSTWRSVGGSGLPTENSAAEQTYRAKRLYAKAGAGQWPHCGPRLFT